MNQIQKMQQISSEIRLWLISFAISVVLLICGGAHITYLSFYRVDWGFWGSLLLYFSIIIVQVAGVVSIATCRKVPVLHQTFNIEATKYFRQNPKFVTLRKSKTAPVYFTVRNIFFMIFMDDFIQKVDENINEQYIEMLNNISISKIDERHYEKDEILQNFLESNEVAIDYKISKRILKAIGNYAMAINQKQLLIDEVEARFFAKDQSKVVEQKVEPPKVLSKFERRLQEFEKEVGSNKLSTMAQDLINQAILKEDPNLVSGALTIYRQDLKKKKDLEQKAKKVKV